MKLHLFLAAIMLTFLPGCDDGTKTTNNDTCGDEAIQLGEACDGANLGAATCVSLGFEGGTLSCTAACSFDTSACQGTLPSCGNGVIDTGEECDGTELNSMTCEGLGLGSGELTCLASCRFDRGQCDGVVPGCGNAVKEGDEACDGTDFGGATCASFGYHGGAITCTSECIIDLAGCVATGKCGDGIIQDAYEQCDGVELNGATCASVGHHAGTLACGSDCQFDYTNCLNSPPAFASTPDSNGLEGILYSYQVVCTEDEGDPLTLSVGASDSCGGELTDAGDGTGTYSFTPTESMGGGTCNLNINCSDGNTSIPQNATIAIAETNTAPVVSNTSLTSSAHWRMGAGSFDADHTDADVPAQTVSWSITGSSCLGFTPTIAPSTGIVSYSCFGVETCEVNLTVTDNGTPAMSDTAVLTISCTNGAPTFSSTAPVTASEGLQYSYTVTCVDPNGDPLTVAVGAGNTCGGTLSAGTYTFTPTEAQGGTSCDVALTCGDTQAVTSQLTTVSIAEANQAPVITNSSMNVSAHWRSGTGAYDVDATDADVPAQNLVWSLTGTTCAGFTPTINFSTGVVSFTCTELETCQVSVRVTDNGTPALNDTESLTIDCTNTAPQITSTAPTTALEGILYQYAVTCTDPNSDPVSVAIGAGDTCGGSLSGTTYSFTPGASTAGTSCQVEVTCGDTKATTNQTSTINIFQPNYAPVITNGPMSSSSHWRMGSGSVDADYTDANTPAQTITWSLTGNTCTGFTPAINGSTGLVSYTCSKVETCNVTVVATDNGSPAMNDTELLTITCTNTTPVITSTAATSATEGILYSYPITCTDANSDPRTYAVGAGNTCAGTISGSTYTFTPTETQGGATCTVSVTCSDTQATATQTTTVTVAEVNQAPVISNASMNSSAHWRGGVGSFDANYTDADSPVQTITWSLTGNTCTGFTPSISPTTGIVSYTCTKAETCSASVTATDNGSPTLSDTETLTITCTNTTPVITSTAASSASEGTVYSYNVVCTDANSDPRTITVGAANTCPGTVTGTTYSFTPTELMGGTTCVVAVNCSDTQASVDQTRTVTIAEVNSPPVITSTPLSSSAHWRGGVGAFDADYTDPDDPIQTITWSLAGTTCTGFTPTINFSTGVVNYTCSKVETCTATVRATDNGSPAANDTETLTITCTNTAPEITSTATTTASEGVLYSYSINCTDANSDPVTVAVGAGNTCAGTISGGTYTFTPTESQGGGSCNVVVTCSDTKSTVTQTTTVVVAETNQSPVLTNLPATDSGHWGDPNSFSVIASDADIPAQLLSYTITGETCAGFDPVVNTSGLVTWTCGDVEACSATVAVSDGVTSVNATLGIACENINLPSIDSMSLTEAAEEFPYQYLVECSDGDGDELIISIGSNDTCGGTFIETGDGTALYEFTAAVGDAGTTCDIEIVCSDTQHENLQFTTVSLIETARFVAFGSGRSHSCAIDIYGSAWCWGAGSSGKLGDNTVENKIIPTAVVMPPGRTFVEISPGGEHTCATDQFGDAWCWGAGSSGQLGNGAAVQHITPYAVSMPTGKSFVSISSGAYHTCAIDQLSKIWCWGYNYYGALGDGTNSDRFSPVAVIASSSTIFTTLNCGDVNTCALVSNGSAWCWGHNNFGQLGDNTVVDKYTPTAVIMPLGRTFETIAPGNLHTCAIDNLGSAWCWGYNNSGQLGDNTLGNSRTPKAVVMPSGRTFGAIALGNGHTCAVDTVGSVWCWGKNSYGQLGDNTVDDKIIPTTVIMPPGRPFSMIDSGLYFTCALDNVGSAWCWGQNLGQLGDNTTIDRYIPTNVYYLPTP